MAASPFIGLSYLNAGNSDATYDVPAFVANSCSKLIGFSVIFSVLQAVVSPHAPLKQL